MLLVMQAALGAGQKQGKLRQLPAGLGISIGCYVATHCRHFITSSPTSTHPENPRFARGRAENVDF